MDTLERLATNLSLEERQKMFEKLRALSNLSGESLYPVPPDGKTEPVLSAERQYAKLPWYYRLFYFIAGIFKNKAPHQIFTDAQIGALGRRIDTEYPGFYDYQKGLLLAGFYQLLAALKEDARFFFDALDSSVNRDRGGFYAFLGSLEMPEIHRALEAETEPGGLRGRNPAASESELRQNALRVMEEVFARITEAQRAAMYRNARSLYCLKELSSFLYDRVLLAFGPAGDGQSCSVRVVKELLGNLNNTLFSLRDPPSLALLESLFVFVPQEREAVPGRELQQLLGRAERALANIRNFNRALPLTLILKCGNRDIAYCPRQISGGEDWYTVYRDYWRRYVTARFAEFIKNRRREELGEAYRKFFSGAEPLSLANAAGEGDAEGFPLGAALSLSFLLSFYKLVFVPEINPLLLPVAAEGGFINKENRAEFAGGYNDLAKLGNDIQGLDRKIGAGGVYGERYAQARQDTSSLPVKRRKIQLALEDAEEEGRQIVERARLALGGLVNTVAGIVKKETGGRYESLSNFAQLEAAIPDFSAKLREAGERLKEALKTLDMVAALEAELGRL
ncbi:MAG: DUF5312 domain-containing protein [Treponema sp.]|nr:DUF5312 domain-containing protein [Treponema sp.]